MYEICGVRMLVILRSWLVVKLCAMTRYCMSIDDLEDQGEV